MKKFLYFLCTLFFLQNTTAQNIGIGTTTPNANAILDISSPSKGILIPRMDSVKRKAIPATNGLMVYDTTTKCFWYNDGTGWANMPPKGNNSGDILYWNGAAWKVLPAGQGGQYLSLTPGTLTPVWTNVAVSSTDNVSTKNISNIAPTSAVAGGNIVSDAGAAITARGIVWGTSPNPTTALSTKTNDGSGIGSFTSNLTNLLPATTYYVRAYATNNNGTTYGNQVTFATISSFTTGQQFGGGVVFYVDNTGQHGLIVSAEDLSIDREWSNTQSIVTNATGLAIGTGQANTNTIINAQGAGLYAATLCRDFYSGGGFTDWYLPSILELNQLFLVKNNLGLTFSQGFYWSSSEFNEYFAWVINFGDSQPNQSTQDKYFGYPVRAIRKF
jgi:hypothetical protein